MIVLLKNIFKYLLVAFLFYLIIFVIFNLFSDFTGGLKLVSESGLLNWDAAHYYQIKNDGYDNANFIFFPLFPLLWKLLNLNAFGIIYLNTFLYIFSFISLTLLFKFKIKDIILLLSIPSLIFMFLPYTEALFYAASVIIIWGLNKNKVFIVCLGLFLCCMTRPVIYILLPAILLTEYLTNNDKLNLLKKGLIYISSSLAGLALVLFIQFYHTGDWLSYFKAIDVLDNNFSLPLLPLTSWAGGRIVRLDGSALLVGIIAIYVVVKWLIRHFNQRNTKLPKELLFSTLYIAGISLLILSLFRGGSLHSLNRFIYATPFFAICLFYFLKNSKWSYKQIGFFILSVTLFWLLFNSWVHIQTFLKFGLLTFYLATYLFMTMNNKFVNNIAFYTCLVCNISLQIYFYHRFLTGEWVG